MIGLVPARRDLYRGAPVRASKEATGGSIRSHDVVVNTPGRTISQAAGGDR